MINIIAIFMHSDFAAAKITARENQEMRQKDLDEKIEKQVKKMYADEQKALVD